MDSVDDSNGVFITAEGLLMYLQPGQALELISQCAKRFPGGQMIFDLPRAWFSKLSRYVGLRPTLRYKVPPMRFKPVLRTGCGPGEHSAGHSQGP
jgi:O-methyltransferase involved in polyketide biosynthesis